jgi:hypothetical protein
MGSIPLMSGVNWPSSTGFYIEGESLYLTRWSFGIYRQGHDIASSRCHPNDIFGLRCIQPLVYMA